MKYALILIVVSYSGFGGGVSTEFLGLYGTQERCQRAAEYNYKVLLDVGGITARLMCLKSNRGIRWWLPTK